jgi:hypothetical protein
MRPHTPLDELTDDYLTCRALRHAWDPNPHGQLDTDMTRAAFAVVMLRCVRCGTEAYDLYGPTLARICPRRYVYPDGYQKITLEDNSRPALYGELLRRSTVIRLTDDRAHRTVAPRKRLRRVV